MCAKTTYRAIALIVCTSLAYLIIYRPDRIPVSAHSPEEGGESGRVDGGEGLKGGGVGAEINTNGTCTIPNLTDFDQFYSYFEKTKAACTHKEQVGGRRIKEKYLDGDKWVCFDNGLKPDECVVYSFGISNEWSFDDDMDLKRHCQVFAFDPTMAGVKDHKRSQRISFYNLGISNRKGYTKLRGINCSMDTYRGIVEKLGHSSTVIDYLKMDIEGSEIGVLKDIMDNDLELLGNIRQIGLEIHPLGASEKLNKRVTDLWEIFHRLECLGWRLLKAEMNPVDYNLFRFRGSVRSTCYELVWIK